MHFFQRGLGHVRIHHCNPSMHAARVSQDIEHYRIVGPINAGLHKYHAIKPVWCRDLAPHRQRVISGRVMAARTQGACKHMRVCVPRREDRIHIQNGKSLGNADRQWPRNNGALTPGCAIPCGPADRPSGPVDLSACALPPAAPVLSVATRCAWRHQRQGCRSPTGKGRG